VDPGVGVDGGGGGGGGGGGALAPRSIVRKSAFTFTFAFAPVVLMRCEWSCAGLKFILHANIRNFFERKWHPITPTAVTFLLCDWRSGMRAHHFVDTYEQSERNRARAEKAMNVNVKVRQSSKRVKPVSAQESASSASSASTGEGGEEATAVVQDDVVVALDTGAEIGGASLSKHAQPSEHDSDSSGSVSGHSEREPDLAAPADVPYADSAPFRDLRLKFESEVNDMHIKAAPDVAATRLAELEERHLTPAHVDAALRFRRKAVQENMASRAEEYHEPLDVLTSPLAVQRVHDCVLQLMRVLSRRQVAVLRGEKLPRARTIFSMVKGAGSGAEAEAEAEADVEFGES
jgi:hypothetical protein